MLLDGHRACRSQAEGQPQLSSLRHRSTGFQHTHNCPASGHEEIPPPREPVCYQDCSNSYLDCYTTYEESWECDWRWYEPDIVAYECTLTVTPSTTCNWIPVCTTVCV